MSKKLYIDSDSLLYRAAYINNNKDEALDEAMNIATDEDAELDLEDATESDSMQGMINTFNGMVKEIVDEVEDDSIAKGYDMERNELGEIEPILVITVKGSSDRCDNLADNFRYEIMEAVEDPDVKAYKHNRQGMEVPDGLLEIYNYVYDLENCICVGGIEADDVVVHHGLQGHIVAALDKDVLYSLPYAYNFGKMEWVEYTEDERRLWFYGQIVTGDSSDGLRGAYRVGQKWVEKNLLDTDSELELWTKIVTAYYGKEQTLEEAIATARCVSMTQWTPENGLVYWQPPKRGE